ncbi:MAG: mechanosensitive ion channel family protein [Candidatus Margulisbacteria bacterium]|nr:mechanosensitive ion channel family protein [Candidatus Margulisiibacteriota bacterium]MBU1617491.1 mechanosensitive ion channel family protein [Candidatus Margulisiibacteriota bacterium]
MDIQALINIIFNSRVQIFLASYLVWVAVCWLLVKWLTGFLGKIVSRTETEIDDIILQEARLPLWLALLVIGFYVISMTVGLPRMAALRIERLTELSIVFIIIYLAARLAINFIKLTAKTRPSVRNMIPTFNRIANIVVWGVGLLMLMDLLGVSVTPVLASLGIAGLAVGLALQDTLGSFFAGLYILIDQPVRVGDYVEIENGLKGYVEKIGWRETMIRTLPNNMIVVPNTKLSQSIITNYYLPHKEIACLVEVGVSYDSDLEKVERVTCEVGREVLKRVDGGIKNFEPFIRYHTFADFSVNFTVILRVAEFVDNYLVKHEFIKALHKRYKEEGIEIPFPIRTVRMNAKN